MKRIVFFVSSMGDGGAQRVISILSEKMADKGMKIEILTFLDIPNVYHISEKVKLTCVQKCTGEKNLVRNLIWMRNYLKEHTQIVLSFLAPFNMLILVSLLGTGIPVVVADRNDPEKVPGNLVIRKARDFIYKFARRVIVQTEKNKSYFKKLWKKTTVIYNPVNMKQYQGIALNTDTEKLIVSVGRLEIQKNQKLLIDAFQTVLEKYPQYRLVIYGEGSYRSELEEYVTEKGLSNQVFMPGSVTDLYERIKSAEVFVLSSDYEGMPNALIEAMCMGLPVISTEVSGATDLIQNRKNGILVPTGDKVGLVGAMEEVLGDKAFRTCIAKEAVKIAEKLSPDVILNQWIRVIEEVEI